MAPQSSGDCTRKYFLNLTTCLIISCSYVEVYKMMRGITGTGQGKGPAIAIHDGFAGVSNWGGFMTGADRMVLDTHPYFAFGGGPATDPIDTGTGAKAGGTWPGAACDRWTPATNTR